MRTILLSLMLSGFAFAQEVNIPVVGQPSPFFGAAGRGVVAVARVEPTKITRDESCDLSIQVSNLLNAPDVRRPAIEDLGEFTKDFQVDNLPDGLAKPGERIFRYRLRPRRMEVTEIPVIVFPYYDPNVPQPPDMPGLPFRKARTNAVSITITKPEAVVKPAVPLVIPPFADFEVGEDTPSEWENLQFAKFALGGIQVLGVVGLILIWKYGPSKEERQRKLQRFATRLAIGKLSRIDMSLDELSQAIREYRHLISVVGDSQDSEWNALISRIEERRFAPSNLLDIDSIREEALALVRRTGEDA